MKLSPSILKLSFVLVFAAVLTGLVPDAASAQTALLTLEGPDQRSEGALPAGRGTFAIKLYAQGQSVQLAGLQLMLKFTNRRGVVTNDFRIVLDEGTGNENFEWQAIWPNPSVLQSYWPVYKDDPAQFDYRLLSGFMYSGTIGLSTKKLLMTIVYEYDIGPLDELGTYTIDADALNGRTMLADPDETYIPFTSVAGSVTFAHDPVTLYVDDNAPNDPGPGDVAISDPLEDGSAAHPFDSIQKAVDASYSTDTIIIKDGIYTGTGNRDINFLGRAITVRSENGPGKCTINVAATAQDKHRAFTFDHGESTGASVSGLTIMNGNQTNGGAIYCSGASPLLKNLVVRNNTATYGGAIYCASQASPILINITAARNTAATSGGAIYCASLSSPIINSAILWGNTASSGAQVAVTGSSSALFMYSSIQGGQTAILKQTGGFADLGDGMIDEDPQFADILGGDLHLKSEKGRWDPAAGGAGAWVIDTVSSPCIDAGDPDLPYSNEPANNGGCVNMGGFGNTAEASKHVPEKVDVAVQSVGATNVTISGTVPGVTSYTTKVFPDTTVSLTAPATATVGLVRYSFLRWVVDGGDKTIGVPNVQFVTTTANVSAVAVYEIQKFTLTVQSSPAAGAQITGDKPGTTNYAATCDDRQMVLLTAPIEFATPAGVRYNFAWWTVDGSQKTAGQTTIGVTITANTTAVAAYNILRHTLTVQSQPNAGVVITGTRPGTTTYTATCDDREAVSITAAQNSGNLYFMRWKAPGDTTLSYHATYQFAIAADTTVIAEYDVVRDFYVNDGIPEGDFAAGDNLNSGMSRGAPMASIQALLNRYPNIGTDVTVHVSAGTFYENVLLSSGNSGLTLKGAGADLTTINGKGTASCIRLTGFTSGVIRDFTITNGYAMVAPNNSGGGINIDPGCSVQIINNRIIANSGTRGGGIYCAEQSTPVITNNVFTGNTSDRGGAIRTYESAATIKSNLITGNTAVRGGGIALFNDTASIVANNLIVNNNATDGGGGVYFYLATLTVGSNTIAGNTATTYGGGVYCYGSAPTLTNTIVWGNTAPYGQQIAIGTAVRPSTVTVTYSSVAGGQAGVFRDMSCTLEWGTGNVTADPLFASANDYHLKSEGGRWDPAAGGGAGAWVQDVVSSPCIDTGNPATPFASEPVPNGARINMGAYGNTAQASKSPPVKYTLSVQSTPVTGVNISGDKPGTTNYSALGNEGSIVSLVAPGSSGSYVFMHWTLGGVPQTSGQTTLLVTMSGARTAVAVYEIAINATLSVQSTPAAGVVISGAKGGTTNYAAPCSIGEQATLTAPWQAAGLFFLRWKDSNGATISREAAFTFIVAGNATLIAEYGEVAQFYVNDSIAEAGIAAGSNAFAGTSPDAPAASIQVLLGRYPAIGSGCTVRVSAGTFAETITIGSGHNGLTLTGAGAHATIVNANGGGACITVDQCPQGAISGFTFTGGRAASGGGIVLRQSSPSLQNCVIAGNAATANGGGISCEDQSAPTIRNVTITGNRAAAGGGVSLSGGSAVTLVDSIVWGNEAPAGPALALRAAAGLSVRYSNIAGGQAGVSVEAGCTLTWGSGNINAAPLFAANGQWNDNGTPGNPNDDTWTMGDYHLKSLRGRWDVSAGNWVNDTANSPCIDAGDPASGFALEPAPNLNRVNCGAFGNTAQASRSGWLIFGDVNGDCSVNVLDLIYVRNRLNMDVSSGDNWKADVNMDGKINVMDLIAVRNVLSTKCK